MNDTLRVVVVDDDPRVWRRLQEATAAAGVSLARLTGDGAPTLLVSGDGTGSASLRALRERHPESPLLVLGDDDGPDVTLLAMVRALCGAGGAVGNERVGLLLDDLRVGIFRSTREGRLLWCNRSLLALLGLEELRPPFDITVTYHALEDRRRLLAELERTGLVREFETRLRRRDGSMFWGSFTERLTTLEDGLVVIDGILEDVTANKQAEEILQESEERFRRLLDAAWEGVIMHEGGTVIDVSPRMAEMFGYEREALSGTDSLRLIVPQHRQIVRDKIAAADEEAYEVLGLRSDGMPFPIEIRGRAFPFEGRTVRVATVRDLTSERQTERRLAESRRALSTLFANLPGMAYRCCNDRDWTMEFVSRGVVELTGYQPADLVDSRTIAFATLIHPEDRERVWDEVQAALAAREMYRLTYRLVSAAGETRWVWERGLGVRDEDGDLVALEGFISDISELKWTEQALRRSEATYRTIFENTGSAMVIVDENQLITLANGGFLSLVEYRREEVEGRQRWTELVEADDQPRLLQYQELLTRTGHTEPESFEVALRTRRGERREVLITVARIPGARTSVASMVDITERKRAERQLLHDAFHDGLTGLPNRALLADRLDGALERARRRPRALFAVLLLDLDRFKTVNEGLGHRAGDRLLVALAERLRAALRRGDTVARLGGDEFVILLDELRDVDDASFFAERLHGQLAEPFEIEGQKVYTSASIGIALSTTGYEDAEDVLRDADIAMYRAKSRGTARTALFDTAMHERAVHLLEMETNLRQALENNQFRVHYQPIVSLSSGRMAGLEALVRWQHPVRGLVTPDAFIGLAEDTGLILPLGGWVLQEACRHMVGWQGLAHANGRPFSVSVNLSARQLMQRDLVTAVAQTLRSAGLPAEALSLEITESVLMEHAEEATVVLEGLRGLGVRLHLDDFGMGYSSLAYLNRYPLDSLKIDRSFVSRMAERGEDLEIVRAIATLARSLGLEAIAEGVETVEQATVLRELGCAYAQGYLFSRPIPAEDVGDLLRSDPHW